MDRPYIVFIEGCQGCGKSSCVRRLREELKYVTMLDLNAIADKSVGADKKMCDYHSSIFSLFENCKDLNMNFVVSRSYMSESVYATLGYKPYDFKQYAHYLRQELDYLTKFYDVYFILLTATEEDLKIRLNRDKFAYNAFSVDNSLNQQQVYKDEMKILVEDTEEVKAFEIENDILDRTVNTIKDIILGGFLG